MSHSPPFVLDSIGLSGSKALHRTSRFCNGRVSPGLTHLIASFSSESASLVSVPVRTLGSLSLRDGWNFLPCGKAAGSSLGISYAFFGLNICLSTRKIRIKISISTSGINNVGRIGRNGSTSKTSCRQRCRLYRFTGFSASS